MWRDTTSRAIATTLTDGEVLTVFLVMLALLVALTFVLSSAWSGPASHGLNLGMEHRSHMRTSKMDQAWQDWSGNTTGYSAIDTFHAGTDGMAEAKPLTFETYTSAINTDSGIHLDQQQQEAPPPSTEKRQVLHLCVLVHGHKGLAADLSYLERVINEAGQQASLSTNGEHLFAVHSAVCNEYRTSDGVQAGGIRLVEEIRNVIRAKVLEIETRGGKVNDVTLSIVGNSLGGLYSRYAVYLLSKENEDGDGMVVIDGHNIHFNVFCSTATPHLGVASHTFFPLPRAAEIGIAKAMGETGKDLFRLNDLLKKMATSPEYLKPLSAFSKRIAYANAFGTDFVVPVGTAAFVSPKSRYPHVFIKDHENRHPHGLVCAEVYTKFEQQDYSTETFAIEDDDLVHMSHSLDSLGWKKVFVDMRGEIPIGISLPTIKGGLDPKEVLDSYVREECVVESKDLVEVFTTLSERISWPIGHNMIVAFSRSKLSKMINRKGRPVMETLAKELVEEVFAWRYQK